jgi:Ice-binding-like
MRANEFRVKFRNMMNILTNTAFFVSLLGLSLACEVNTNDDDSDGTGGRIGSGGRSSGGRSSGGSGGSPIGSVGGGAGEGGSGGLDHQDVLQEPVPLGQAATFAVLASAGITNIPRSVITGDIGLTPDAGSNINGFSEPGTCPEVTGEVYVVDATGPDCAEEDPTLLEDAKADARVAFLNARASTRGTPGAISGDIAGLTIYPGLYESGTSLEISAGGAVYLDAEGDEDAVFILRSETSITTESTSKVVLTDGARATNVYWTAGSAVTLGTNSTMKGTILAGTSISLLTGAKLEGRAINQGTAAEAITLDACTIVVPAE